MTKSCKGELELYDPEIENTFRRLRKLQRGKRIAIEEPNLIQDSIRSPFLTGQIPHMATN